MRILVFTNVCLFFLLASPYCFSDDQSELSSSPEELGKARIADVPTYIGFKYFSGNLGGSGNFPAIYAHGYNGGKGVTVTGKGYHRTFTIEDWGDALRAYKALLELSGYEIRD
ncbi:MULTISPECIES: hypothetical protein [unclassified Halomonas]|uniref:hypothetical protein n=1 Tax=unclassified Halomonas TaxID=2609666 RepID=UPI00288406FA|nr:MULTISPECIES: hypothetical protein [unclassified Halomonas]MDT0500797.1 hypothetical protein [Halomonas sp. PAR7]MDT0513013.1 hypothetical protein [Halomonas sp. LES1]MDT0591576.1 hypothetical protein [Halomonas sp. PAR8]